MSEIRSLVCNVAQSTHYEVQFGGFDNNLKKYLSERGVDNQFINDKVGLLCLNANLPSSAFATALVNGNYTGIQEKIAHTRLYSEITLEFYVDLEYKTLKFFEHWMDFISSGSNFNPVTQDRQYIKYPNMESQSTEEYNYSVRMQYPEHYKCNQVKIYKFEKDYKNIMEYTFIGMFPLSMNPITVSYINSESLKVSLNLQYDRYVANKNVTQNIIAPVVPINPPTPAAAPPGPISAPAASGTTSNN